MADARGAARCHTALFDLLSDQLVQNILLMAASTPSTTPRRLTNLSVVCSRFARVLRAPPPELIRLTLRTDDLDSSAGAEASAGAELDSFLLWLAGGSGQALSLVSLSCGHLGPAVAVVSAVAKFLPRGWPRGCTDLAPSAWELCGASAAETHCVSTFS